MKEKLLFGLGVYYKGKYLCWVDGKQTREYVLWAGMLRRVTCKGHHKKYPTYIGCTVSNNFKNFQYFAEWCNRQIGFNDKSYQLDKDILQRGNKIYSEDTCCFVPSKINSLIIDCGAGRGDYPVGVYLYKESGKFQAHISKYGKQITLGYYKTIDEAFSVYCKEKEIHIKEVAEQYKEFIDPRVYYALLNWRVVNEVGKD